MWTQVQWNKLTRAIDHLADAMIRMQQDLVALPAIGPTNGGTGEFERQAYLKQRLTGLGLEVVEHQAPDDRVPCNYRPSLVGLLPGREHSHTTWIMSHVDIVPPGPRELWLTDPHQAVVKDGRIYGRGAEDNQQGIVASFFALQALIDLGFQPGSDVGLVLVADEETGSRYGIDYVLKNEPRFRPNDIILVPDAGNQTGSEIEVAEKSIVWLKFTVIGKQAHGSRPDKGRNALRAGAKILLHIDRILHERYPALDPLFDPPGTTVEPTKKEANVPNINTIPAEDIFYFDCRVLPNYQITELLDLVQAEAGAIAQQCQVDVRVTTEQFEQAAPPTPSDAPVVKLLTQAVREVYGIETRTIGIGGGTVAAFFRRAGFPAAVWGRFAGTAHQPNEYCEIANLIGDAKVYAHIVGQ